MPDPMTVLIFMAGVLAAGAIGFYFGQQWRPTRPRLTGYPQVVDLQGTPMRIVQMETAYVSQTFCMDCGAQSHHHTVTFTLKDEAGWREAHRVHDREERP